MSWCDKLASTPTVGFFFPPHATSGATIADRLAPLIDKWWDSDQRATFNIDKQDGFSFEITNDSGLKYIVDLSRIVVDFNHRLKLKPQSGGPPIVEMISTPQPYTVLLPRAAEELVRATELILGNNTSRPLEKVGIVTTTTVAEETVPPGIRRLLKLLGSPWESQLQAYHVSLTAKIKEGSDFTDRCGHLLIRTEQRDALTTLKFDWQRTFKTPRAARPDYLKDIVAACSMDAMKYFEELAEGTRFNVPQPN